MATNTYVALDKVTVSSAVASVTFSSIPSGYTDLVIVGNLGTTSGSANIALQVGNGSIDTGSNYSFTNVNGDGSTAASSRASNQAQIYIDYSAYPTTTLTSAYIWQIQNYSNTTTYKTVLGRSNTASRGTNATVGLWRSTSAINTIKLDTQSTTFLSGSTFSLYGIAAEGAAAKATGGYITSDSTYWYHTFLNTGTFTPTQSLSCEYLVVAGGGGGASRWGGGGGAGGFRTGTGLSVSAQAYTITVGAGGAGGSSAAYNRGTAGTNSSFSTITSTGGGAGGTGSTQTPTTGGSGGGGGFYNQNGAAGNAGSYSPVEGYAGGNTPALAYQGAGGGGAGGAGSNATTQQLGGAGGIGSNSVSTWASVTGTGDSGYYAGGGGGGGETANSGNSGGAGGLGGGGRGGNQNGAGVAATINTGGGGGGGGNDASAGAAGGSGIVIIRYAK